MLGIQSQQRENYLEKRPTENITIQKQQRQDLSFEFQTVRKTRLLTTPQNLNKKNCWNLPEVSIRIELGGGFFVQCNLRNGIAKAIKAGFFGVLLFINTRCMDEEERDCCVEGCRVEF
jgi:hypothetical protein